MDLFFFLIFAYGEPLGRNMPGCHPQGFHFGNGLSNRRSENARLFFADGNLSAETGRDGNVNFCSNKLLLSQNGLQLFLMILRVLELMGRALRALFSLAF